MSYVTMTAEVIDELIAEIMDVLTWADLPVVRKKLNGILVSLRSLRDEAKSGKTGIGW